MFRHEKQESALAAKVLVADDDESIRTLLRYNLQKAGLEVVLARDGAEAMARMTADVAVALLDLRMPEIDGLECLRKLMSYPNDTQVIVITRQPRSQRRGGGHETGGLRLRPPSPLDMDGLVALVKQAARTSALSPREPRTETGHGRRQPSDVVHRRHAPRAPTAGADAQGGRAGPPPCSSPARAAPERGSSRA